MGGRCHGGFGTAVEVSWQRGWRWGMHDNRRVVRAVPKTLMCCFNYYDLSSSLPTQLQLVTVAMACAFVMEGPPRRCAEA